jgi:predicted transcriptional regulator
MTGSVPPALPDLEREVMEEVWRRGSGTVHEIRDALNASSDKERAYTTVMTVLTRLADKGMLERHREGRSDRYVPAFARGEYLDARAADDVETLLAAYGDVALAHFAERVEGLDPERRAQLRRLREGA